MRLLDKQEIAKQKTQERKSEIDEGVKLIHKVGVLRETYAKEEANLAKFRNESLNLIKEEITDLTREKKALEIKVASLKEEKAELRKPLDKEWKSVQSEAQRLRELDNDLLEKKDALLQIEEQLDEKTKELRLEEERIEETRERVKISFKQSEEDRKRASEALSEANKQKESAEDQFKAKSDEILKEWAKLEVEKRGIINTNKRLEVRENLLNNKEKRINDKYETLQRTIKRLKNGRTNTNA